MSRSSVIGRMRRVTGVERNLSLWGLHYSRAARNLSGHLSRVLWPLRALGEEGESARARILSESGSSADASRAGILRIPSELPLPLADGGPAADSVHGLPAGGVGRGASVLVSVQHCGGVIAKAVERVALLQRNAATSSKGDRKITIITC